MVESRRIQDPAARQMSRGPNFWFKLKDSRIGAGGNPGSIARKRKGGGQFPDVSQAKDERKGMKPFRNGLNGERHKERYLYCSRLYDEGLTVKGN